MTDWKKAQGSQVEKPQEFDTATSAVIVYQRKNIERITVKDEMSGQTVEMWQYDERELTHEEYAVVIAEVQQAQIDQNRADIEFISAMSDIDLGE